MQDKKKKSPGNIMFIFSGRNKSWFTDEKWQKVKYLFFFLKVVRNRVVFNIQNCRSFTPIIPLKKAYLFPNDTSFSSVITIFVPHYYLSYTIKSYAISLPKILAKYFDFMCAGIFKNIHDWDQTGIKSRIKHVIYVKKAGNFSVEERYLY